MPVYPVVFDGHEDRNGTHNHDETRCWNNYIKNRLYRYDDNNRTGGLGLNSYFVCNDGRFRYRSFRWRCTTGNPIDLLAQNNRINQNALFGMHMPVSLGAEETPVQSQKKPGQ